MNTERYNEDEALAEAEMLKTKIEKGEAGDYAEAERVIERERAVSKALMKMESLKREHLDAAEEALEAGEIRSLKERKPTRDELDDAREIIAEFLAAEEYPKVTVAREHLEEILKTGLQERPTAYQKNVSAIVGTIGRQPLLPEDSDRVILEIRLPPSKVDPRFTGEANLFDGIVHIKARVVPPEAINVIEPKRLPPESTEEAA